MVEGLLLGLTLLASANPATVPHPRLFGHRPFPVVRGPMNEIIPGMIKVRVSQERADRLEKQMPIPGRSDIVAEGRFLSRVPHTGWTLWQVPIDTDIRSLAKNVKLNGDVACAEPVNRVYALLDTPNDGDYAAFEDDPTVVSPDSEPFRRLWHLDDTDAEFGWPIWPNTWFTAATKPANAPLIAFVDTGADMRHPDFINAGGSGPDVTQGGQWMMNLSKQFHLAQIDPSGTPEDHHGHGTHVAGIGIASGNNGSFNTHGVIGIGYNSRGMMERVFDDTGVGTDSDAAAAIYYAADNGADVINMSIGTTNFSQEFQDAVTYAFQKGTFVVCSGNENGNGGGNLGPIYPAACTSALGVSANGPGLAPATTNYSGYGYYVGIAAPGGDVTFDFTNGSYVIQYVWSTAMRTPGTIYNDPNNYPPYTLNYAYLAGTSMATPMVAGAAGQFLGQHNLRQQDGWTNVRVYQALQTSAYGVMGAPYGAREDVQGYGCLDMYALMLDGSTRGAQAGGIKGIVYNNATATANTTVRATPLAGGIPFSTTTHADGTYQLDAVPPGYYHVVTAPNGLLKSKNIRVIAGADTPGVDFWCGTFTWDSTPPVVARVQVSNVTASGIDVRHWAYDPETGIDLMTFRIGTSPGGNNVMADREVYADSPNVHLAGLSLSSGVTYYLRAHYVDGAGYVTDTDVQFQLGGGATNVAPTGFSVFRGVLVSGGLADLINSDDSRLVVKNGIILSSGESPVTVTVTGTSPMATVSNLNIRVEAQSSTPNLQQGVDLFDYTANAWVTVDARTATVNADNSITITATSPNRFIQSGTRAMQARVRYRAAGPLLTSSWQGRIDQVQWQLTP